MEYEYTLECSVCDSVVTLIVEDNEENPRIALCVGLSPPTSGMTNVASTVGLILCQ